MSERFYRLIIGVTILLLLLFEKQTYAYVPIGLLLFEGVTNLRIPVILSRMRNREDYIFTPIADGQYRINFEAERVARFAFSAVLVCSLFLFYEQAWFFAWFLGSMLVIAGISNFCPMIIFLRWIGFR